MGVFRVFTEVVTILEESFAFWIKTFENSRRICVVFRQEELEIIVFYEVLAAQKSCVQNGAVSVFLVHV
jgi:hypothetical protein